MYCCPPDPWMARTRDTIAAWGARSAPVVLLTWDDSGRPVRGGDTPDLRERVLRVREAKNADEASDLLQAAVRFVRAQS
jgi:hypothetical protein